MYYVISRISDLISVKRPIMNKIKVACNIKKIVYLTCSNIVIYVPRKCVDHSKLVDNFKYHEF